MSTYCLFISKSFLTNSFFSITPAFSTIYRPLSSYVCSNTPKKPRSVIAIASCEVQVSTPDSQTVRTVATGVSKPLCYRLTLTFTLTIANQSLYITLTTVAQGVDNHSWGLHGGRCYCICVCWGRSNRIFHIWHWHGQLSTGLTKDEGPHPGYTFTPWVVSLLPLVDVSLVVLHSDEYHLTSTKRKSTLVQVKSCCRQPTNHFPTMTPFYVAIWRVSQGHIECLTLQKFLTCVTITIAPCYAVRLSWYCLM